MRQATTRSRSAICRRLFLFGRYQLQEGPAEHQSATSIVRFAKDSGGVPGFDDDGIASPRAPHSGASGPTHVVLKFMKHRDQFEREIRARSALEHPVGTGQGGALKAVHSMDDGSSLGAAPTPAAASDADMVGLSSEFVVPILRFHDPDADPKVRAEMVARRLEASPYVIVFPAAERSLQSVIDNEREQQAWGEEVRLVAKQLCGALAHLHARDIVHCDLKPRNIVRQGHTYKLIDLDSTAIAGVERVGYKVSSAYVPPEMIVSRQGQEIRRPGDSAGLLGSHRSGPVLLRSASNVDASLPGVTPLIAAPSFDMWSLGASKFSLCFL